MTTGLLKDRILSSNSDGGAIDAMLKEIAIKAMEPMEAYQLGCSEGQEAVLKEIEAVLNKPRSVLADEMALLAEAFYHGLTDMLPQGAVKQLRIGVDYTTRSPVVLAVISHEYEEKTDAIMKMGISIDIHVFRTAGYNCGFWVITDHRLDQELIEHDFPWYRVNL